jgi:hypothetical protein
MQTQRQTDDRLDTLVKILENKRPPGFSPMQYIKEISLICVEEKSSRAEGYLRFLLGDTGSDKKLRIAAFLVLTKIIMPRGLACTETLEALSRFENDPDNSKMLSMISRK